MKRRRVDSANASLLEVAYAGTGSMLKAARLVAFVLAWGQLRDEIGREPTVAEYAEHWGESQATVFRHQALFRQVFPRCETPGPVLDLMRTRQPAERRSWAQLVTA